jgi:hypothetical protein
MNENYDVKGPVRRLEQRRPCVTGLEHLHDHWSFDVEFSPTGQVVYLANYIGAGTIHRSYRSIYDNAGKLLRTLQFDADGVETSSTDFERSEDGSRATWTTRDTAGGITNRVVEEYVAGLLMSYASFGPSGLARVQKKFEYAGNKPVTSVSLYYGPNGDLVERLISKYDSAGRLAETFGLKSDGTPLGDGRYVYEYDDDGRKIKTWSFNEYDDSSVPNHLTSYAYKCDAHGNWIECCERSRSKSDSRWMEQIVTRSITYYPSVDATA